MLHYMKNELMRKPDTYLTASLLLYGLFIWLLFWNLPFLASASLTPALNRAYYSGDWDKARQLSARARMWFISGCIPAGLVVIGIPAGALISLLK